MQRADESNVISRRPRRLMAGALALSVVGLAGLTGCETDSFMDPSVTGRWERTPTTVPILERLSAIEGESGQYVDISGIEPEDLVPEVTDYRIAPGDAVQVTAYDLIRVDAPEQIFQFVDSQGSIDLPQIGRVRIAGMTSEEARDAIADAMRALVADPLVILQVTNPRQNTYSVLGGQMGGGQFLIPAADFRVLDAMTQAGGLSEIIDTLYVIRQVPLTESEAPAGSGTGGRRGEEPRSAEDLLDLIDTLGEDRDRGGSPAAFAGAARWSAQPTRNEDRPEPVVDLVDPDQPRGGRREAVGQSGWTYEDGRWVRTGATRQAGDSGDGRGELMTQRVIQVPVAPLLAGDARYNIVIRPGDIIRIPNPFAGQVYVAGQVARPGVYGLAPGLTLQRLIDSAGGLGAIAIPERVDLTRMVGPDRQATIRLNLRAIAEGTEPDIYIKANDRINIGTNFWATPLAVIRGGFRASYGFGFLLDRNFGNDVFGAPPTRLQGG
ncbi:MAG: hypothetical protein EA378_08075 [Phycisphaerales bacterium]|nr:MAG: hypothetical protein EA378_08075 [Phycisphaerales bacterium]